MPDKYKIPIKLIKLDEKSYHLLIVAKINKVKVNLIIDTGASRTVFDKSLLGDDLKVTEPHKSGEIQSAGIMAANIESVQGTAASFKLGKLKLRNFQVILIDLEGINLLYKKATGKKVHGLLGSDFLLQMKAVINYDKEILFLTKPDAGDH